MSLSASTGEKRRTGGNFATVEGYIGDRQIRRQLGDIAHRRLQRACWSVHRRGAHRRATR
jgi:hypothetical protein